MKNILELKKDVSTIEQFAINSLITTAVIRLGSNSKTPILIEGFKSGAYVSINEHLVVQVVPQNPGLESTRLLQDFTLTEVINILNSLGE